MNTLFEKNQVKILAYLFHIGHFLHVSHSFQQGFALKIVRKYSLPISNLLPCKFTFLILGFNLPFLYFIKETSNAFR